LKGNGAFFCTHNPVRRLQTQPPHTDIPPDDQAVTAGSAGKSGTTMHKYFILQYQYVITSVKKFYTSQPAEIIGHFRQV
jgi:hypothetical protein